MPAAGIAVLRIDTEMGQPLPADIIPAKRWEERMGRLFAIAFGLVFSIPTVATAQQDTAALARVHVMTGPGTLPRNPTNRLEFLRYALTGEKRLTGNELIKRIPEVQQFARVSVEADQYLPYDQPQELKALSLRISARLKDPDILRVSCSRTAPTPSRRRLIF
jgi:hypothetical protein